MKRLALAVGALVMLVAGSAHAQYGMAGCGLGAMLFGHENSTGKQVLAATTNGTFGTQTFGITRERPTAPKAACSRSNVSKPRSPRSTSRILRPTWLLAVVSSCPRSRRSLVARIRASRPSPRCRRKVRGHRARTSTTPIQMLVVVKQQIKASPTLATSCTDERAIARAESKPMTLAKR